MQTYQVKVAGQPRPIHFVEDERDAYDFRQWLQQPRRALAIDTESTGLDIFAADWQLRLVQVADTEAAWVLRPDLFGHEINRAVYGASHLIAHNATFDLLSLDRAGIIDAPDAYGWTWDTRILAHLLDPRAKGEGGIGHGLKELAAEYVDPDAPDGETALKAAFREGGWKHADGWRQIPIEHPDYITYAGLDALLTARLFEVLVPKVKAIGLAELAGFEHRLAALLARMERRGFLLDVPYTEGLLGHYDTEREAGLKAAANFGVGNAESTGQVAAALEAMGASLTDRTPTGKPKVDRAVLRTLAAEGNELAAAVLRAKQANKFRTAYVEAMLDLRDAAGRVHPKINSLQARTARMSVSHPPLQQLPAGDATIRHCLVADPGQRIIATDYAQIELRILAALADEPKMRQAIAAGVDLHDFTAGILFGDSFTPAQRKLAKGVSFGRVYGGGAATLSRQTGVTVAQAKAAIQAYDSRFPGVRALSRRIIDDVNMGCAEVVTPMGRRLPVDPARAYSGVNYLVQSAARDVLAQSLLNLEAAGLEEHLLLPVHDEVIAQAPTGDAAEIAREIERTMSTPFQGVQLDATASLGARSWGSLYDTATPALVAA